MKVSKLAVFARLSMCPMVFLMSFLLLSPSVAAPSEAAGIRCKEKCPKNRGTVTCSKGSEAVCGCSPSGTFEGSCKRVAAAALAPDPYYLSDFPEALIKEVNIYGGLQYNRVSWQEEVWIRGVRSERALGMHAPANVGYADFKIPPGARFFRAVFGIARQDSTGSFGRAAGRVFVDGQLAWQEELEGDAMKQTGSVELPAGARVLRLEVDGLGDGWSDHTTWADPHFSAR